MHFSLSKTFINKNEWLESLHQANAAVPWRYQMAPHQNQDTAYRSSHANALTNSLIAFARQW